MINSLPDGSRKQIAEELGVPRSYVSEVLSGGVNPDTPSSRKIVERAGAVAAMEIFKFSWDERRGR